MRYVHSLAYAVAIAFAATPAVAKNDHAKGPPSHKGKVVKERSFAASGPARGGFSAADHTLVRVYFVQNPVAWTGLPPGIAKNYARGKPLPPGIAKKVLPAELLARLPAREGYEYARVGPDVVLIETATRIVVDVIERIFD